MANLEGWTHDLADPRADAEARELTFSADQAAYLGHHIRNSLQMVMANAEAAEKGHARLLRLAATVEDIAKTKGTAQP